MRICVYGAGAMGTSFGALLSGAGVPCELVSRNEAHVSALRKGGARLIGCGINKSVSVTALTPREMTGEYDVIFLAAKQRENGAIARFLVDFLKEDGALVSLQNGLPEEALAGVLGNDRIYGAALSWGAEREAAGCVRVTSESGFHVALGSYGSGARLSEIEELLRRAFTVNTGNLAEIRYAKLAVNSAFSTLSAISGLTFGEISVKYKRYALKMLREALDVARAANCKKLPLNGHDLFKAFGGAFAGMILPIAMKKYSQTRSGMLKDLREGRRCDVDFVAGAVVREAEKFRLSVPYTERAQSLVHEIENGLAELAPESILLLDI